jgi:hypothetical protein
VTVWLFLAALLGGALNSVAGGGSFVTLPALLYAGITPIVANATSTLALWPGSVSSAIAYRHDIRTPKPALLLLGSASLIGGLLGALLLVRTSDTSFMRLLPWLMLLAATTFTFGGRLRLGRSATDAERSQRARSRAFRTVSWKMLGILPVQLVIATYGGYFGGGMGIMMLAALSVVGMTDIHEMNGLKALLGATINGVALAEFIRSHAVSWGPGLVMVVGGILGGYLGATLARKTDRRAVRAIVITIGWSMTIYFFLRARP